MKDGTTHLAYKPEHAVDLDTGVVVAAELVKIDFSSLDWTCWRNRASLPDMR